MTARAPIAYAGEPGAFAEDAVLATFGDVTVAGGTALDRVEVQIRETSGEVVKIYVENGQPVEYGQPLFGIKK